MPSEDKYVLRHEWERANRNIDGKINEVDNKHIALHNDLKLLVTRLNDCLLYTSPSPRDQRGSRMPSSA